MKKLFAIVLALCLVLALAATAFADWAPSGPVSIIVSYKAGSGTDNTARILAKYAEKYVGQTLVIENVEGGSGSIGWSQINLPNFSSSIVNDMGTYTVESFAAICNHVTETSIVIVRAADDRFPDLQALVDFAKAQDFGIKASTNGPQASNHIGAQAFANSAGFTYIDIPQGGTADQLLSLRGAEADFAVVKLADIAGQESEYSILAVFNDERLPELPDVPTLKELGFHSGLVTPRPYVAIKAPVFSFAKMQDVDISLGPEMKSTGEVMGIDYHYARALYKAIVGAGMNIPTEGCILFTVADKDKEEMKQLAKAFSELGFQLVATEGTAKAIHSIGIDAEVVGKVHERSSDIIQKIKMGQIHMVINTLTQGKHSAKDGFRIRRATVEHGIACLTSLDTAWEVLGVLSFMRERRLVYSLALQDYVGGGDDLA